MFNRRSAGAFDIVSKTICWCKGKVLFNYTGNTWVCDFVLYNIFLFKKNILRFLLFLFIQQLSLSKRPKLYLKCPRWKSEMSEMSSVIFLSSFSVSSLYFFLLWNFFELWHLWHYIKKMTILPENGIIV